MLLRKGVWHIDNVLFGKRVCESTRTGDLKEAEMLLAHRVTQARKAHLYGEPGEHTFREAGVKSLAENQHKRSIARDVRVSFIFQNETFREYRDRRTFSSPILLVSPLGSAIPGR